MNAKTYLLGTIALGLAIVAPAAFAQAAQQAGVIERPAAGFHGSVALGAAGVHYEALLEQARRADVKPRANALRQPAMTPRKIRRAAVELRERIAAAEREAKRVRAAERRYAPQNGAIEGVPLAALEAIAACESGGDPTAVNAAGYYGKYQFDQATWQSVGGSGNPAAASESEQDYRAAVLYSRAGASPWPVCGQ